MQLRSFPLFNTANSSRSLQRFSGEGEEGRQFRMSEDNQDQGRRIDEWIRNEDWASNPAAQQKTKETYDKYGYNVGANKKSEGRKDSSPSTLDSSKKTK